MCSYTEPSLILLIQGSFVVIIVVCLFVFKLCVCLCVDMFTYLRRPEVWIFLGAVGDCKLLNLGAGNLTEVHSTHS